MRINWNDMPDAHFEELTAALLRAMGFVNVAVRTGGLDDGWDIDAEYPHQIPDDTLQIQTWRVECKRYRGTPPGEMIRDHYLRMTKTNGLPDYVLFVTTGSLSNPTRDDLKDFAKADRVQVQVWEREKLTALLQDYRHDPQVRALIADYVDQLIPLKLMRDACGYQVTAEIERRVSRKYLPNLCRARPIEEEIKQFLITDLSKTQLQEVADFLKNLRRPALEASPEE